MIAAIIYEFIFDTSRRGIPSSSSIHSFNHQQQQLTQYQQASYLHHRSAAGPGTISGVGGKSSFFQDHFDFDLERGKFSFYSFFIHLFIFNSQTTTTNKFKIKELS